jgi:hypothetical protein
MAAKQTLRSTFGPMHFPQPRANRDGVLQAVKHDVHSTVGFAGVYVEAAAQRTSRFLCKSPDPPGRSQRLCSDGYSDVGNALQELAVQHVELCIEIQRPPGGIGLMVTE